MKKENNKNKNINNENSINKTKRDNETIDIKESKIKENNNTISIKESNIQKNDENEKYNNKYCLNEKKIITYLIVLALVLVYYSLFFIHNINFRGIIKDTQWVEVKYPQNNNEINNSIDINNSQGNTITNIVANNNTTNSNLGNNNIGDINQDNNNSNNGTENNNPGNNNSNNNTGNGNVNNPGEIIIDNKDRFKIMQGKEEWNSLKNLDIFNNIFLDSSKIAPGVYGEYNFTVENYKNVKIKYSLNFIEKNMYNINMVYKMKLNGSYIAGNEHTFVKYYELSKENLVINANSNDIFTIEWKWQEDNSDTQIGKKEDANYKLNIKINSSEL